LLWDEWPIFSLENPRGECSIRLPFEDLLVEPEQEKPHRKQKLKGRSRTAAGDRN